MANVDPNIYALNIQLQMDSSAAFAALDDLTDTLEDLETKISNAANSILNDITNVGVSLNNTLDKTVASIIDIDTKHLSMVNNMTDYNRFLDDSSQTMEKDLKNLQEVEKLWKNISNYHEDIDKGIKQESTELLEFIKTVGLIDKAIKEKNDSHAKENDYVQKEGKLLKDIVDQSRRHGQSQKDVASAVTDVYNAVKNTFEFFAKLTKQADEFRTVNFRLYGSQMDLLNASQRLSGELGIAQEEAITIYKELANAREPKAEIEKMARTIGKMALMTGISSFELVKYTKAMRAAGFSTKEQEKNMLMLAKAMKEYGISSADAARATNYTGSEMLALKRMFNGSKEEVDKFMASMLQMQGIAGLEGQAEGIIAFRDALKNPENMLKFESVARQAGIASINTAEDFSKAAMIIGKQFADIEDAAKAQGKDGKQIALEIQARSEAMLGSADAGDALATVYRKLEIEAKKLGKEISDLSEAEKEAIFEQSGVYNTLTAQLDKFNRAIYAAFNTTIVRFFADGLRDLLKVVNGVIEVITKVITWLSEMGKYLYDNNILVKGLTDGFMVIFPYIRGFAALLLVAVAAAGALGFTLTGLLTTLGGFGRMAQTVVTVSQALSTSIVTMARAIGQSIFIILSSLGRGLASLGQAVTAYLPALFALATMTLMVGVSFYLVALALVEINKVGWPAIAMFAVMAVIMLIFIGVLIALGAAAMAVIPGLLVLSLVMVSIGIMVALIGAGIMMIGMGVLYIGMGIEKMAAGLSLDLAGQVLALAASLGVLAAAAWFNMVGIASLAAVFRDLGNSIKIGEEALKPITDAVKAMGELATANPATKFIESLNSINDSIQDIDMSKLRKIATDLNEGARAMMAGMIPLLIVSAVLAIAGSMFVFGATALSGGINLLDKSASLLLPAAIKIQEGFARLQEAMPVIYSTSLQLLLTSPLLLVGALIFTVASAALFTGSVIFAAASSLIFAGANMFKPGAQMLDIGTDYLISASVKIASNALVMTFALYVLGLMAGGLYAIGMTMILGGGMLIIGALLVFSSAITLNLAFMMLESLAIRYEDTIVKIAKLGEGLKLLITGVGSFYTMTLYGLGSLVGVTAAFSTEIDTIITQLDEYATAFERAAVRISEAVNNKIIPAMQAARQAGVMEAIRSEAIIQQGELKTEGSAMEQTIENPAATEKEEDGGQKVLSQILYLLQDLLPEIADKGGRSFGTNMSGW